MPPGSVLAFMKPLYTYGMKKTDLVGLYIKSAPKETREILQTMRETIASVAPKAEETIKYGIPTFTLYGENLVHFGGFKKHVSFFPTPSAIVAFSKELGAYPSSKGTVKFSLEEPIPYALVKKIVRYRVKEVREKKRA